MLSEVFVEQAVHSWQESAKFGECSLGTRSTPSITTIRTPRLTFIGEISTVEAHVAREMLM